MFNFRDEVYLITCKDFAGDTRFIGINSLDERTIMCYDVACWSKHFLSEIDAEDFIRENEDNLSAFKDVSIRKFRYVRI